MTLRAVLLFLFARLSTAQINSTFYTPPAPDATGDMSQNPVYRIGSTVQVRWAATWDRISLCLFQNGQPQTDYEFLLREYIASSIRWILTHDNDSANTSNSNNYDWIVTTTKDISSQNAIDGNLFSLYAYKPGTFTYFQSHFFNLTSEVVAPAPSATISTVTTPTTVVVVTVSSALANPVATGVSSTGPGSDATSAAVTTAAEAAATSHSGSHHGDNGDSGLGTVEKVGLGVGIGVGVPLFIAVGIITGWALRAYLKRKKAQAKANPKLLPWKWIEKPRNFKKISISPPKPVPMHELPGPTFVYELPHQPFSRSTVGTTGTPILPLTRSIIGASIGASISDSSIHGSSIYTNTKDQTFMRDSVSSISTREF